MVKKFTQKLDSISIVKQTPIEGFQFSQKAFDNDEIRMLPFWFIEALRTGVIPSIGGHVYCEQGDARLSLILDNYWIMRWPHNGAIFAISDWARKIMFGDEV